MAVHAAKSGWGYVSPERDFCSLGAAMFKEVSIRAFVSISASTFLMRRKQIKFCE